MALTKEDITQIREAIKLDLQPQFDGLKAGQERIEKRLDAIEKTVTEVAQDLTEYIGKVDEQYTDHEQRISKIETQHYIVTTQ